MVLTGIKQDLQKSHIFHQLKARWDLTYDVSWIPSIRSNTIVPSPLRIWSDIHKQVEILGLLVGALLYGNLLNIIAQWICFTSSLVSFILCLGSLLLLAHFSHSSPEDDWSLHMCISLTRWHFAALCSHGQDLTTNAASNTWILCSFTSKQYKQWVQDLSFFPYISEASTFLHEIIKHHSKPKILQKWVNMPNLWAKPS